MKAENVVFGQLFIFIEIYMVFLAAIEFLNKPFLLSDPNYLVWHQVPFRNFKAENVVFGEFRTLIESIAVLLAFIIILTITVIPSYILLLLFFYSLLIIFRGIMYVFSLVAPCLPPSLQHSHWDKMILKLGATTYNVIQT